MTKYTYRDTTWRTELMGSEGWAVFFGPTMLASNLIEEHARLIVAAPELLKACRTVLSAQTYNQLLEAKDTVEQAVRKAEQS